jgi:hypothetical protein
MDFLGVIAKLDLAPTVYLVAIVVAVYVYTDKYFEDSITAGKILIQGGMVFLILLVGANLLMTSEAESIVRTAAPTLIDGGLAGGRLKVSEIDFDKNIIKAYQEDGENKIYILLSFTDYAFWSTGLEQYSSELVKKHWFLSLVLKIYAGLYIFIFAWAASPTREVIAKGLRRAKKLFPTK